MTGFKSKKAAALDADGMYLVHHTEGRVFDRLGNKIHEEDDDTQVYGDALTIAYQSGFFDGKKAAQRPWVDLTEQQQSDIEDASEMMIGIVAFSLISDTLKANNT